MDRLNAKKNTLENRLTTKTKFSNHINIIISDPRNSDNKIKNKSFFLKNGKHLSKDTAVKYFREDMKLAFKMRYKKPAVAMFGSARTDKMVHMQIGGEPVFNLIQETGYLCGKAGFPVCTGGGTGAMQAANLGAIDAGAESAGFQPRFIEEFEPPVMMEGKKHYRVHTMHSRKLLMPNKACALVFFPGGFGTADELFEYLIMAQQKHMQKVPIIMFGKDFWKPLFRWLRENAIKKELFSRTNLDRAYFTDSPKELVYYLQNHVKPNTFEADVNRLMNMFEVDISKIYDQVENLLHPSVSVFGSSRVNENNSYYKNAISFARFIKRKGYTIYFGGNDGIAKATKIGLNGEIAQGRGRDVEQELGEAHIPIELILTRKLVLGATDSFIFHPGGLGTMDELSEYLVRIQIGDMEPVPVNLIDKNHWAGYVEWLRAYPIHNGLADEKNLNNINIVNEPVQLILP
jgi:uncharacterized protein (TIGR00730 family)